MRHKIDVSFGPQSEKSSEQKLFCVCM